MGIVDDRIALSCTVRQGNVSPTTVNSCALVDGETPYPFVCIELCVHNGTNAVIRNARLQLELDNFFFVDCRALCSPARETTTLIRLYSSLVGEGASCSSSPPIIRLNATYDGVTDTQLLCEPVDVPPGSAVFLLCLQDVDLHSTDPTLMYVAFTLEGTVRSTGCTCCSALGCGHCQPDHDTVPVHTTTAFCGASLPRIPSAAERDCPPACFASGASVQCIEGGTKTTAGGRFGQSVALACDRLLVGAPSEAGKQGRTLAFRRNGLGQWAQVDEAEASDRDVNDAARYGAAVDATGTKAVVGAPNAQTCFQAAESDLCLEEAAVNPLTDVFYVTETGAGGGTSWDDAGSLSAALASTEPEVWVQAGSYSGTFTINRAVRVYGGFTTGAETARAQRNSDPATNGTALTGNNAVRVIEITAGAFDVVLDGLTVLEGSVSGIGAGILTENNSGMLTIRNAIVRDNVIPAPAPGDAEGGAMFVENTNLTLCDVAFVNNAANDNENVVGGAIQFFCNNSNDCLFYGINLVFEGNRAMANNNNALGGAISVQAESNAVISCVLVNAVFVNNLAQGGNVGRGGAIRTRASDNGGVDTINMSLVNCTFAENTASEAGGGINMIRRFASNTLNFTAANCIFWQNSAPTGTNLAESFEDPNVSDLRDCLINDPAGNGISGSFSAFERGAPIALADIKDEDPLFVNAPSDVRLQVTSPAVDCGYNPNLAFAPFTVPSDLQGVPRITNCIVDMGAYEQKPRTGAAYVLRKECNVWVEEQQLLPDDAHNGQQFGAAVVLDGQNHVLVGAPGSFSDPDDCSTACTGCAYMFCYDPGTVAWTQVAKMQASDGAPGDQFGAAVALERNLALVGAPGTDGGRGSVYIFQRTCFDCETCDQLWDEEALLVADDGEVGDAFGSSVALALGCPVGDLLPVTALVGAPLANPLAVDDTGSIEEVIECDNAGRAYLFVRDPRDRIAVDTDSPSCSASIDAVAVWRQAQTLELAPEQCVPNGRFGHSVSLDEKGTLAAVGAPSVPCDLSVPLCPPLLPTPLSSLCVEEPPASGTIYHVSEKSSAVAPDGLTWQTAFTDLQDALASAVAGDEVWIAAGTYNPDGSSGNRTISFVVPNNVVLYGGFKGVETARSQREWCANETVLSGDIGAAGVVTDNSFTVVVLGGGAGPTGVDGVIVEDGYDDNAANSNHGGVSVLSNNSFLRNSIVRNNFARSDGGGVSVEGGTRTFVSCNVLFENNSTGTETPSAGALRLNNGTTATLINCVFRHNRTGSSIVPNGFGGAILAPNGTVRLTMTNCVFYQNESGNFGGALDIDDGTHVYINCTFVENNAFAEGGALNVANSADVTLHNCILWNNSAGQAGGEIVQSGASTVAVENSIVEGGVPGAKVSGGMVTGSAVKALNPRFVDQALADLRLQPSSPAVNCGDNTALAVLPFTVPYDLDGLARVASGTVDLGAYEYQCPRGSVMIYKRECPNLFVVDTTVTALTSRPLNCLPPAECACRDLFGYAVDIYCDTVAVGAPCALVAQGRTPQWFVWATCSNNASGEEYVDSIDYGPDGLFSVNREFPCDDTGVTVFSAKTTACIPAGTYTLVLGADAEASLTMQTTDDGHIILFDNGLVETSSVSGTFEPTSPTQFTSISVNGAGEFLSSTGTFTVTEDTQVDVCVQKMQPEEPVISVNFAGGSAGGGFGPFNVAGSTGVVDAPNWNNPAGPNNNSTSQTNFPLMDSNGNPNQGFLTVAGIANSWASGADTSTDAGRLLRGYFDNINAGSTIDVTGLASAFSNNGYSVYVYYDMDSDGTFGVTVTDSNANSDTKFAYSIGNYAAGDPFVESTATTSAQASTEYGLGNSSNYLVLEGFNGEDFSFSVTAGGSGDTRPRFNGFQVVSRSAVPLSNIEVSIVKGTVVTDPSTNNAQLLSDGVCGWRLSKTDCNVRSGAVYVHELPRKEDAVSISKCLLARDVQLYESEESSLCPDIAEITSTEGPPRSIWYITPAGGGTGASWASPTTLVDALANAAAGAEIWVRKGTYQAPLPTGFDAIGEYRVYGGFSGAETNRSQRNSDPTTNATVLTKIGGTGSGRVLRTNVGTTAEGTLFDGFTLQGGRFGNGGAVEVTSNEGIAFRQCRFVNNEATADTGGAMHVIGVGARVHLCGVAFMGNTVGRDPTVSSVIAGRGGAVRVADGATLQGVNVQFIENEVFARTTNPNQNLFARGGALYITGGVDDETTVFLANALFYRNHVTFEGTVGLNSNTLGGAAAVDFNLVSSRFVNCVFVENEGSGVSNTFGGGFGAFGGNSTHIFDITFDNCIFWENVSDSGSDLRVTASGGATVTVTLNRSLVTPPLATTIFSSAGVTFVPPGPAYTGVKTDDPMFVNQAAGDLRLGTGSNAIDCGDNALLLTLPFTVPQDLDGNARIQNQVVDLGPYESEGDAFLIPSGTSSCPKTVDVSTLCPDAPETDQIVYVTVDGGGDGSSWASPTTLASALATATADSDIWVRQGTYAAPGVAGFTVDNEYRMYGGFVGTETSRSERDSNPATNSTVLTKQAVGATGRVVLVTGSATVDGTLLDGFTITGGSDVFGPGIHVDEEDGITLRRLNVSDNRYGNIAPSGPGAMEVRPSSIVRVCDCTFKRNITSRAGGIADGGAIRSSGAVIECLNCFFEDNEATNTTNRAQGGAISIIVSGAGSVGRATLVNCVFVHNTVNHGAGFNFADGGGAVFVLGTTGGSASALVVNCTMHANQSLNSRGGAIMAIDTDFNSTAQVTVVNSVLNGNLATVDGTEVFAVNAGANVTLSSNVITGGTAAPNVNAISGATITLVAPNKDVNPLFVAPPSNLRLQPASPAVDCGDNSAVLLSLPFTVPTDIDGNARIFNGVVDMGAYETLAVNKGDEVRFCVTITNQCREKCLQTLKLVDRYDSGRLMFVSASPLEPTDVNAANGTLVWDDVTPVAGGTLDPGESLSLTLTFRAACIAGTAENVAKIDNGPECLRCITSAPALVDVTLVPTTGLDIENPSSVQQSTACVEKAPSCGCIWYVATDGCAPTATGKSWDNATTLQDALMRAQPGDEVWVKRGTYALTGEDDTFMLARDVQVFGGFAGTETKRHERNGDGAGNGTVLSGNGVASHVVTVPPTVGSGGGGGDPIVSCPGPTVPTMVFSAVPEASQSFVLAYEVIIPGAGAVPNNWNSQADVPYSVDNSVCLAGVPISRVAYYLELETGAGVVTYAWASFDPFNADVNAYRVPTLDQVTAFGIYGGNVNPVGALFTVNNMNVVSNVVGVTNGTGLTGNLEFWPSGYVMTATAGVGSSSTFDLDDSGASLSNGYGSMQIHNRTNLETVIAVNRWRSDASNIDIGIGNQVGGSGHPDWTFAATANNYTVRTMQIFVQVPGGINTALQCTALDGFTVRDGTNAEEPGAGIVFEAGADATLRNLLVTGNMAPSGAGLAIDGFGTEALLCDVVACENTATGSDGGGAISVSTSSRLTAYNVVVEDNEAEQGDGGGCIITGNAQALFVNALWRRNSAAGSGGALAVESGQSVMVNNTFNANTLGGGGGNGSALSLNDNTVALQNSIVWQNAGGTHQISGSGANFSVQHSIVEGGLGGISGAPGTVVALKALDPLFVANGTDQHLQAGSPAVDCADDAPLTERKVTIDLGGLPRIVGVSSDLGVYERQ